MNTKIWRNSISLFLFGLLLCGADCSKKTPVLLTIENYSGQRLKIKSYNNKTLKKIIEIQINEEYSERLLYHGTTGLRIADIFTSDNLFIDSLIVIYGDHKKSFFRNNDYRNERNPLTFSDFTFTFTEADYANAEDCEGSCE